MIGSARDNAATVARELYDGLRTGRSGRDERGFRCRSCFLRRFARGEEE